MSLTIEGVRSIITYYQANRPTSPENGDIWINSFNGNIAKYENGEWFSIKGDVGRYGYGIGNNNDIIDKIVFPFDSGTAGLAGSLSLGVYYNAACNSTQYGFVMGGSYSSSDISSIQRFTFSFNSGVANVVGNLNYSISQNTAGCNSSQHGYSINGYSGANNRTYILRITFPFNSGTSTQVGGSSVIGTLRSACNSSTYGYIFGGYTGGAYSTIDRFLFPLDSGSSTAVGILNIQNFGVCGMCNSSTHGYVLGGSDPFWTYYSQIERITFPFASGTASNVGYLSVNKRNCSSFNSTIHGYATGGVTSGTGVSSVDRITFPFNSGTGIKVGNLSGTRSGSPGIDETDFIDQFI